MKFATKYNLVLVLVFSLFAGLMFLVGGCKRAPVIHRRPATIKVEVKRVPRCNGNCRHRRYGLADIPANRRHANYGGGSCVFASVANDLETLGLGAEADRLVSTYSGGESAAGLHSKLDAWGWDYAATTDGDVAILNWADRHSRGAMVTFKPNHVCGFLGWQDGHAVILDPNSPDEYEYWPRAKFLQLWRHHGGWATAIVANAIP
jgi:hypothetical protein